MRLIATPVNNIKIDIEAEYWNVFKTRFIKNYPDASDQKWDYDPHLFYDNKSSFE